MFNKHFMMSEEDVLIYIKEKTNLFGEEKIYAKEIGDGNINYVFRIYNDQGKSVILKHANTSSRTSPEKPMSVRRNEIEYKALIKEGEYAKEFVPKVYFYDPIMCSIVMEDLSDMKILRKALMEGEQPSHFPEDITDFMVKTLFPTTDIIMEPALKKELMADFINPGLCRITEELVFQEPFIDDKKRNEVTEGNRNFIKKEIYQDEELILAAAKLKDIFKNKSQALIHGDLHTGSIFINAERTVVIDPEFAFYGPIGYDLGNLMANLIFAKGRALALGDIEQSEWIKETLEEIVFLFIEKSKTFLKENTTDLMAKTSGFLDYYLEEILKDGVKATGMELIRRIVGIAKVEDIESLKDIEKKVETERYIIELGKHLIKENVDIRDIPHII